MIRTTIDKLPEISAKKRAFLSFLAGAVGVMGLAPLYWWPVYFISFGLFSLLLYTAANKKSLFWSGWSFGFGFFTFGLYWISLALHIDWAQWWWLTPFSAIGLPIYLSLYYGLAATLLSKFRSSQTLFIGALAAFFAIAEYLRGVLFTGFPWNLPSYIWVDSAIGQNLAWGGAYSLNIFIFLTSALAAFGFYKKRYAVISVILIASLYEYGTLRLMSAENMSMTDKTVLIVQPNIPQIEKWDSEKQADHFEKLLQLTGQSTADYIIWPETALTIKKNSLPSIAPSLEYILKDDQLLLSGITDVKAGNGDLDFSFYNSMVAIDSDIEVPYQYNKHHLVPFGEYVPFRKYLKFGGVAQMLSTTGDFKAGLGPRTIQIDDDFSISPLICYEVIFPGRVTAKSDRPDLLVNITNDGWYLNSTGPYQHLAMSRARAIETGIPLTRSANTGISAMIDPYGQLMLFLPLQTDGTIISTIPEKPPQTLFDKYNNFIFLVLVFTIFLIMSILSVLRQREKA